MKKFFDVTVSIFLLVILLPVMLVISATILFKIGSTIVFSQERPGYKEKIFTIYKFRTMKNITNEDSNLLDDELRITSFG
ncbi:MAG: hypothetical protein HN764_11955 [Gammaproteobacteria bacterium]|jgi:lipopolysaccharide/colanic/teichoic acid biosynthesis glycosyltransferase|nr:hypothetical protein [Gammaproteobacteria bacterium]